MLKQILFHIAKAPFMGKFVGFAFLYFCWAIPVRKLYNSRDIVAFYHPKYQDSFVLVSNGGKRQEVGQVYFHMFTDHDVLNANWEIHKMLPLVSSGQITEEDCRRILQRMELLEAEFGIRREVFLSCTNMINRKVMRTVCASISSQARKENLSNEQLIHHRPAGKACRNFYKNIARL